MRKLGTSWSLATEASSPPAQLSRGSQNIIDLIFTGVGRSCAALQAWEIITSVSLQQLVIEMDVRYKQSRDT